MAKGLQVLVMVMVLAGCGVGPEAARLAQREAALTAVPADDAQVRAALIAQADAWGALAVMLEHRHVGGMPVGSDFRVLVGDVALLARRQRALIESGEDDPEINRELLARLGRMWRSAADYLKK